MKGLFGAFALLVATSSFARDPMNEVANYKVDRARARTSSMVRGGGTDATVAQKVTNTDGTISYDVNIDYDMDILLGGRQSGTEVVRFPADFFTEEFLVKLRQEGHFENEDFKVKHEGFADATTMEGRTFQHCDKLFIYDIKRTQGFANFFQPMVDSMFALGVAPATEVENMQLRAHVFYGIPVLGAVKIDMTGKVSGFNIKSGFDYKAP